jgi:chromosome segregation ATPase
MKKKVVTTVAKKDTTHSTDDVKRYLGSLSEDFQGRVSALGEQFAGLNRKIDEQSRKLDEHGRKLDEHGRKLDEHSRKLDAHTEMIGAIAEDVAIIKGDLKKKVDYDEFQALTRRVAILEKHARR